MKSILKKIIKIFIILIISLATSILIAELVFRVFYPVEIGYQVERAYSFKCFTKGEYYWISMLKGRICPLSSNVDAFRKVDIRLNNLGLRGNDVVIPKPNDIYRILFIGDSFTFGWGVEETETFPKVVEGILKEKFPQKRIEIVNAGQPASGPGYSYLYLKNEGLILDPDLVVMELYPYTDIVYDMHQNKSIYNNEDSLPENLISETLYVDQNGEITPKYFPVYAQIPILSKSSLLYLLLRNYNKMTITDQLRRANDLITPLCLYKENCHDLDKEKELARKLFLKAEEMTEKSGAKFLAVVIPAEFSVSDTDPKKYPFAGALLPNERGYASRLFDEIFQKEGIDHLTLFDEFNKYKNETTYFINDDHWNSRGHEIAGRAIAQRLIEMMGE